MDGDRVIVDTRTRPDGSHAIHTYMKYYDWEQHRSERPEGQQMPPAP